MTQYSDISLNGLVGSHPLGTLAAFGLLRACSEIKELSGACLYWRMEDEWVAWIEAPASSKEELRRSLIEGLVARQAKRPEAAYFKGSIEPLPGEYRLALQAAAESSCSRLREAVDFYAAFGSEIVTFRKQSDKKDHIKPTAFCMTSGNQDFLSLVQELASSLCHGNEKKRGHDPEDAFEESLFGPWTYTDDQHHLGFDPSSERLYALRHKKPEKDRVNRSVRAAVWLAIESLPLFPTTASSYNRLMTTGFSRVDGRSVLTWPIWTKPIGLDTLRTLLTSTELVRGRQGWQSLARRGVSAVYRSVRSEFGQGYAILRPATLVWSSVSHQITDYP